MNKKKPRFELKSIKVLGIKEIENENISCKLCDINLNQECKFCNTQKELKEKCFSISGKNCEHSFHYHCLLKNNSNTCPICLIENNFF
jgi:hypothetical protein